MYYQFNSMLTSEIPLKDQSFEMFLSELGNYSYHSGLRCWINHKKEDLMNQ